MQNIWDDVLEKYVHNLVSPDGRNTFESTSALTEIILQKAAVSQSSIVVDIGCGWGNFTTLCAVHSAHVIGIEPNASNLKEAVKRSDLHSIQYIQGSFEKLNYWDKADVVISSLVFHQVARSHKIQALENVKNILKNTGRFILCDPMIMFDAESNPVQFNDVYRYLLAKTTPPDIYQKYIEPNLDNGHVYTWDDMKKYTPTDNWFYSITDLQRWLAACGLDIAEAETLCPFLGMITIAVS